MMDKDSYLNRIHFTGDTGINIPTLYRLHQQHVLQVPFENLDVYFKRPFGLEPDDVYRKVVEHHRGGFCYELNSLFCRLLQKVGFTCRIISAEICAENGDSGPAFDHMAILVEADKPYLADVGYGDLFITPLEIREGIQSDGRNFFLIEKYDTDSYRLSMSPEGHDFIKKYTFHLAAVTIDDFKASCHDKQVNPGSYFVQNTVCTKFTPTGRITIFNGKMIEKNNGNRMDTIITDDNHLKTVLRRHFQVDIS